jgi:predicted phage terminase large subunit-like protein
VGHLLQKGTFTHLNLKAIAEEDEDFEILFGMVHHRKRGEPLCPEHESLATLAETRKQIGEAFFSAQYQQNPVPPGGNRIKWEWFGTYDDMPDRDWFQKIVHSWDTAMSAEPASDYSVCLTWGFREGIWYLLDVLREKYDFPDLVRMAKHLNDKWQPDMIIIENSATGKPLYQELRKVGLLRKLNRMKPGDSKELRLEAQTVKLEQGGFLLPKSAHWLAAFKFECQGFPRVRHDDQVDALSQFLASLDGRRGHVLLNPVRGATRPSMRVRYRLVDYSNPI